MSKVRPWDWRESCPTPVFGESRTKQSMKAECDINQIVSRFSATGQVSHLAKSKAQYGDFSNAEDFQSMIDRVHDAFESFDELPAAVRAAADNNPVELLRMLESEDGYEELLEAEKSPAVKAREARRAQQTQPSPEGESVGDTPQSAEPNSA